MDTFSDITKVARTIADHGIDAISPEQIKAIATDAVRRGASIVLAQIVVDPTAPEVARNRAFGRITTVFLTTDRPLTMAA